MFEHDPEGATLALLGRAVPDLDQLCERYTPTLDTHPTMRLQLSEVGDSTLAALLCALANLNAFYQRGAERAVLPTRFVATQAGAALGGLACQAHMAETIVQQTAGTLMAYTGDFLCTEDLAVAYVPHHPALRAAQRLAEAWTGFPRSVRLCEVRRAAGGLVVIVDRPFASVGQYVAMAHGLDALHARLRDRCRVRSGCERCCPCVAPALFSLFPAMDEFAFTYTVGRDEQPMPEWFDAATAPTTDFLAAQGLTLQQNALIWFFAGVANPTRALWRTADHLDPRDPVRALLAIQTAAVKAFRYWCHDFPDQAPDSQTLIAFHLRDGLLYDSIARMVVPPLPQAIGRDTVVLSF